MYAALAKVHSSLLGKRTLFIGTTSRQFEFCLMWICCRFLTVRKTFTVSTWCNILWALCVGSRYLWYSRMQEPFYRNSKWYQCPCHYSFASFYVKVPLETLVCIFKEYCMRFTGVFKLHVCYYKYFYQIEWVVLWYHKMNNNWPSENIGFLFGKKWTIILKIWMKERNERKRNYAVNW